MIGPVAPALPTQVVTTPAHPMLASFGDSQVLVSPAVIASWERARLQPCGAAVSARYMILCPEVDFVSAGATEFLNELSAVFSSLCLGTQTAHTHPIHLLACEHSEDGSGRFTTSNQSWSDGFTSIANSLQETKDLQSTTVVYLSLIHI
eukprot:TRINITY_DN27357_c0_g1_i1.p1 TRINITY_DN27357_c0_g1~~TRINITY_DN27357_c0_g1_i1.p1  ORF type:complete len:149 (+),score=31.34 TRINITY_DN27357_c0_g1_i1:114-560(+)